MQNQTPDDSRRKEIIDICLKKLIEKGLYETTSRDLSNALKMQPSGLYYHFPSKDDVVLQCAEEAAIRLEKTLLLPVLNALEDSERFTAEQIELTEETRAMTRFFAQVCTANKYRVRMQPVLVRMREREYLYCEKFAEKLNCTAEELAPWFFASVASTESYIIFGEEAFSAKPLDFTKSAVSLFKEIRSVEKS